MPLARTGPGGAGSNTHATHKSTNQYTRDTQMNKNEFRLCCIPTPQPLVTTTTPHDHHYPWLQHPLPPPLPQVYAGPIPTGHTVLLFNRSPLPARMSVRWDQMGLKPGAYAVRDLWKHQELGRFTDSFEADVPSHGLVHVNVCNRSRCV